jgi:hypothetical protein
MDTNIIELEKDLQELDKLIGLSTRQNIKRNLENHKKTISGLLDSERKLSETKKSDTKENTMVEKTDDKYKYTSVTKYAFESSEKFAKYIKINNK